MFLSWVMGRVYQRSRTENFVMEVPPYRAPQPSSVVRHTWEKGRQYLRKMGSVILVASIVIWTLGYFPRGGEDLTPAQQQEQSWLGSIGHAMEPVFAPLGFDWRKAAEKEGVACRIGRWLVPGSPVAVLVDFHPYFEKKNEIYAEAWEAFGVDSMNAYGDYDEASMFSYAAGLVVESFYTSEISKPKAKKQAKVIYHANEWMTGLGALYINDRVPQIATIFTTHATSIGRSIAGNNKPLYEYLEAYNGDQMAAELNMESKHSIEKQTALHVDCFTTVSDITATECKELMDKPVDVVLPNGFEDDFVPQGKTFDKKRAAARKRLLDIARALSGDEIEDDAIPRNRTHDSTHHKYRQVNILTWQRQKNVHANRPVSSFHRWLQIRH